MGGNEVEKNIYWKNKNFLAYVTKGNAAKMDTFNKLKNSMAQNRRLQITEKPENFEIIHE